MYKPLKVDDRISTLIKEYSKREYRGEKVREEASKKLMKYLIRTGDGSYTLPSQKISGEAETMHTIHGAMSESYEKFVKPSKLEDKENVRVLDICSGLGYNSAALIDHIRADNFVIHMIEASPEVIGAGVLVPSPIPAHKIIKRAYEEWLLENGWARFQMISTRIPDNISFKIFCQDARRVLPSLPTGYYDAIFLDAFSPLKTPELYSLDFILELARVIKDDGILTTYTSAAPVRSAMIEAGFHISEGPRFGRKRGGTIASPKPIEGSIPWDDERMIALSDAGIPYRDPNLDDSREEIVKRRENERRLARDVTRLPSSHRIPTYLGRELPEKHAKRILESLKMMKINRNFSREALYIICPQHPECICGCESQRLSSSRERILEMRNRLKYTRKKS